MQNSSNTRQAIWIGIGSFATFGFSIISSMILSRYLSKVDYGTYKQVMYVYNTLLAIFTVGLPQAFGFFLPRTEREEGKSVVFRITSVLFFMGLLFSLVLYFGAKEIAEFLNNENLDDALKIFSPVPLLLLPTMGIESIFATYRKTQIATVYVIITRLILLVAVISPVVLYGASYKEAILGFLVASLLNCIFALYLKNLPFKGLQHHQSPFSYKEIFKFSIPLLLASFWGMIISSSDQFFISRFFGTEVFADYSNGAMELPFVGMIISACSTVLYPLFSKYAHDGADAKIVIYPIWQSVFKKTALLIYPLVVFCWVFADEIMGVLYGVRYETSGTYFKIKLIANLFTLVAYAPVVLSIGKTSYYAKVHMYGAIILILLEFVSVKTINSPYIIVVISVVCQIGRIFAMLHLISMYFRVRLIDLFPISLIGKIIIPSLLFLYLIRFIYNINSDLLELTMCGCIYMIFMGGISFILKLDYLKLLNNIIKSK